MGFIKSMFTQRHDDEVDIAAAADAIAHGTHTIVDVREPDEWDAGHIAEAVHIPLDQLAMRAHELPAETPIYTICKSGGRSLVALEILEQVGRKDAQSVAGGMTAWVESGRDAVR